jgi:hypothetical protein
MVQATENISTPGWLNNIAKGLRAGDLLPYGSITRNGIWALNVSQRTNLAMTPITSTLIKVSSAQNERE